MAERRQRDPTCLFCRIVAGEVPSERVHEDDRIVAFRDIAPRAPTHILLVPREHIPAPQDLTVADDPLVGHLVRTAHAIAVEHGIARKGYRLGVNVGPWAGQEIDHLHLHLMGGRATT